MTFSQSKLRFFSKNFDSGQVFPKKFRDLDKNFQKILKKKKFFEEKKKILTRNDKKKKFLKKISEKNKKNLKKFFLTTI